MQTPEHLTDTEKLQRIREQRRQAAARYRAKHPDRVAAITARYWQRKVERMQQQAEQGGGVEQ
jgi:hypothetical protein